MPPENQLSSDSLLIDVRAQSTLGGQDISAYEKFNKMPKFYMIIAQKIFFSIFFGGGHISARAPAPPPTPTPMPLLLDTLFLHRTKCGNSYFEILTLQDCVLSVSKTLYLASI